MDWAYLLKYITKSCLLAFFYKLNGILSAEPYNCHHPTSNQMEPVDLFLSLSLDTLLPSDTSPTATAHSMEKEANKTQIWHMTYVKHINCLQVSQNSCV